MIKKQNLKQKILGFFALLKFTLLNWHLVKIALTHQLPQLFLGPIPWATQLSYLLWPRTTYSAQQQTESDRILQAFHALGPIFIKFGQIISTRIDMLPDNVVAILAQLQDNVPPFQAEQAEKIISKNIGKPLRHIFKNFNPNPIGSASLAQVHSAQLQNNRTVVIKILRPKLKININRNLKTLYQLAAIIDHYHPNGEIIRATEVIQDYDTAIHNEIDLSIEAANCSQMYRNTRSDSTVHIPKVIWQYCCKNMIVTEFVPGLEVSNIKKLRQHKVNTRILAHHLLLLFLKQTFEHNFFHADMHPGNILIDCKIPTKPIIGLVDFGIVGTMTKLDQFAIAQNLIAFFNRDYDRIIELHIASGWIPPIENRQNMMNQIRAIGEPLYAKPLKEISFAKVLAALIQIARQYHMIVQPQLILLQKTIFNIEALARRLDPELNLWENAKPFVENWIKKQYSITKSLQALSQKAPQIIHQLCHAPTTPTIRKTDNVIPRTPKKAQRAHPIFATAIGFIAGIITYTLWLHWHR